MIQRFRILAACILLGGSALTARAVPITLVDTGPGFSYTMGFSLSPTSSLASEFTLTADATINSIEGWIGTFGGTFGISVHADNGFSDLGAGDGPGSQLFSGSFVIPSTYPVNQWQGLSGLNWDLAAGTYWVVFSASQGSGYMPFQTPNPLLNEATKQAGGTWTSYDTLSLGVRITGTPVPDAAATAILLALALLPLLAYRRRLA